jgi:mannose-6-phosphate isomerase-like protein (cupin superfamily)
MKIVTKSQRVEFKHGNSCTAYEYMINDKDINAAVIKLNGRYPEKGMAMNEISKEMAYVMAGSGKVTVDGNAIAVNQGDLVFVNPGEKFFWEGDMELFMPCTPAWSPEQYKIIQS